MVNEVPSGKLRSKVLASAFAAVVLTVVAILLWPSAGGKSPKRNARVEAALTRLAEAAEIAKIEGVQQVWNTAIFELDPADLAYLTQDEAQETLLRAIDAIESFQETTGLQLSSVRFIPESSTLVVSDTTQNFVRVMTFLESLGFTNLPFPPTPTPKSTPVSAPVS